MQFISKENPKYCTRGHRIIDIFINNCWDKDNGVYVNLGYNDLKRIQDFKDLLLEEQNGFCCYCMRKIPLNGLRIEHVMPQNIKKDIVMQIAFYEQYIPAKMVEYQLAIDKTKKLICPPYPHNIAYENLTASCDGSIYEGGDKFTLHACCNNKRGNNKIIPLFYLPRIHYVVKYEEDGRLSYTDEYEPTIKSLNLDCPSLRSIRKTWARIRNKNISLVQVREAENNINLRNDIILLLDIEKPEEQKIRNNLYWKLLLQFYWFYYYFNLKNLK